MIYTVSATQCFIPFSRKQELGINFMPYKFCAISGSLKYEMKLLKRAFSCSIPALLLYLTFRNQLNRDDSNK